MLNRLFRQRVATELPDGDFKYRAFLSYRSKDKSLAVGLFNRLERYRTPQKLVGTIGRYGPVPANVRPICRDREEFPSAEHINLVVAEKLAQSQMLIVLCTPAAVEPESWVAHEIDLFRQHRPDGAIHAIIGDGEPPACFPAPLLVLHADGTLGQPLAADMRKIGDGPADATLKLLAGLLGVDYDALKQRELQAARLRTFIAAGMAAVFGVVAIFAIAASWLAVQNFAEARSQRNEAWLRESRFLTERADAAVGLGDPELATLTALLALPDTLEGQSSLRGSTWTQMICEGLGQCASGRPLWSPAISTLATALANERLNALLVADQRAIWSVVFSPDDRQIATISANGQARTWDGRTGALRRTLSNESTGPLVALSYAGSPDTLLVGSTGGGAFLLNANDGAIRTYLPSHNAPVWAVAASADGRAFATASADGAIYFYGAEASRALHAWRLPNVRTIAISDDGHLLAAGTLGGEVALWDARTGALMRTWQPGAHLARSLAFSRDGQCLAVVLEYDGPALFDLGSCSVQAPNWGEAGVHSVAFSAQGIAIGTLSGSVRVWPAGAVGFTLHGHQGPVNAIAFDSTGERLATASNDGAVRIWNAAPADPVLLGRIDARGQAVVISNDGRTYAVAQGSSLALFEAGTARRLPGSFGLDNDIRNIVFSRDSMLVAIANDDETRVLDMRTLRMLPGVFPGSFALPDFSPDGSQLAVALRYGPVAIFDVRSRQLISSLPQRSPPSFAVSFSPDGRRILTADQDKAARIWNAANGALLHALAAEDRVHVARYSPDGAHIATGSGEGALHLWEAESGEPLHTLNVGRGDVWGIAFSPGGELVVSVSAQDSAARVWHVHSGRLVAELETHGRPLRAAAFSADGQRVVTVSINGAGTLWDTRMTRGRGRGEIASRAIAALGEDADSSLNAAWSPLALAYHPDGERVAILSSISAPRAWNVWSLDASETHALARLITPRDLNTRERSDLFLAPQDEVEATRATVTAAWDDPDICESGLNSTLRERADRGDVLANQQLGNFYERCDESTEGLENALRHYAFALFLTRSRGEPTSARLRARCVSLGHLLPAATAASIAETASRRARGVTG